MTDTYILGILLVFSAYYIHLYLDNQLPVPVAPEGDSEAPPEELRTPAGSFCALSPGPHIARCTSGVHTAEKSQSPKTVSRSGFLAQARLSRTLEAGFLAPAAATCPIHPGPVLKVQEKYPP